jgi:hypothetical protein
MLLTTFLLGLLSCPPAAAQTGPNTLAQYNPNLRSMYINASTSYPDPNSATTLLKIQHGSSSPSTKPPFNHQFPIPSSHFRATNLSSSRFPADKHPVLVASGFRHNTRQGSLVIDNLMAAQINIAYVDCLKDGKTPFNLRL